MAPVYTLKEGTPLIHVTRSREFQLDPYKAIWLSEVGPEGLSIQYMGGSKKIRFRASRDLDLFVFRESGSALQDDIRDAVSVVQEAVHGGNLDVSALDTVKNALKNALNSDGTRWSSKASVDRDLVDALSASFGFLGIDGWVRDFGNNREFLILQPGANLVQTQPAPPPHMMRGEAWEAGQNRRY